MHSQGASIGTHALTRNVPANIFKQVTLCAFAEVITNEITRISCEGITTWDYPSSLNQTVPYFINSVVRNLAIIL